MPSTAQSPGSPPDRNRHLQPSGSGKSTALIATPNSSLVFHGCNMVQNNEQRGTLRKGFEILCDNIDERLLYDYIGRDVEEVVPSSSDAQWAAINEITEWAGNPAHLAQAACAYSPTHPGSTSTMAHGITARCREKGLLLASIFLPSSDKRRDTDTQRRVVATIAHEMALALPATRPFIEEAVERALAPRFFHCASDAPNASSLPPNSTYGDYYFTALGFALTLLGTLLAAMKTVVTNVILVKPRSGAGSGDGFGSSLPTAHSRHPSTTHSRHPSTTHSHSGHPSLGHSQHLTPVSPSKPLVLLSEASEPGVYQQHEPSPQSAFSALPRQIPQTVFEEPTLRQRLSALLALAAHRVNALFPPPSPGSQPMYGYGYSYGEKAYAPYASHPYPFPQTPTGLTRGSVPMSAYAPYPPSTTPWSGTPFAALPKLSLTPIHLLYLLSPLAFIETTLLAQVSGELGRVRGVLFSHGHGHGHDLPGTAASWAGGAGGSTRTWLLLNGVMAFFLNVVSFHANRRVGPVGMSVAANVKQVLTILCAVGLFDLTMTPANALGIVLTLVGGALYARVEVREREQERRRKN